MTRIVWVALLALACASGASAQQAVPMAPSLPSTPITLNDAVRSTIELSPALALESATVDALIGQAQTTSGAFDPLLDVAPSAGFTMQQAAPSLIQATRHTRDTLAGILSGFSQVVGALQISIRNGRIAPPACPSDLTTAINALGGSSFLQQPISVDRVDKAQQTLLGTTTALPGLSLGDEIGTISLKDICRDPSVLKTNKTDFFQVFTGVGKSHAIDFSGGQALVGFLTSVFQIEPETRLLQVQIADATAARARLALERLGPLPVDDIQRTTGLTINLTKPFRNGVTFTGGYSLTSTDHKFRDKLYDPSFGGLGQPPEFNSQLSVTLNMPLGRGFGSTAVDAPERSARLLVSAEKSNLRQSATEQVFRTSLAYLNLVAAQQTLAALQESQARQQRIVEATSNGIQVGELPRVELDRARARATRVDSSASAARATVIAARVSLAEAMGIDAARLDGTPVATEAFSPAAAALPPADALIARAIASRWDVRQRQQQEAASQTLAASALINVRPRFDVNLNGGVTTLYDSPVFRYLPDEQNPIIPASTAAVDPAIHYFSPNGYYHSFFSRYEPFVTAQLTIELPFGNHAARGRLRQAESALTSSRIETQDLQRSIRDNVVDVSVQLQRAAGSVEKWQAAVRADEELLQNMLDRFGVREVTLIDVLLTEENATRDAIQLIAQRQAYQSILARLKFETGELVTFESDDSSIRNYRFDSSILVGR